MTATRTVELQERPDPRILAPKDVIVRVVAACVCGSDLWPYRDYRGRGAGLPMGHEMVGVIEDVGEDVTALQPGDFVISPFSLSDGTCQSCRAGFTSVCDHVTFFGSLDRDRLHQEAAVLATKADLREEIDRLTAHVAAARELIAKGGPIGRKLDFLAQEFNRESNTICSKSNSAAVTAAGIELKVVIDQFREQVQNLE